MVDISKGDKIIDGKKFASEICAIVQEKTAELHKKNIRPSIAVVLVGQDPASKVYVSNKNRKAQELGIDSHEILLDENISEADLLQKINELNQDQDINAILVQLPLPKHINKFKIINAIDPQKDVDGFHIENVGRLFTQQNKFVPCTPYGCMILLNKYFPEGLTGKKAVILGRSNIVGRPMFELLQQANATVTLLHARSQNIKAETNTADILISAVGKPKMIDASYLKDGAVVIDVGINRVTSDGKSRLVGDIDFEAVIDKVSAITPVPGGVGPMTIACLMLNSLKAAYLQHNLQFDIF